MCLVTYQPKHTEIFIYVIRYNCLSSSRFAVGKFRWRVKVKRCLCDVFYWKNSDWLLRHAHAQRARWRLQSHVDLFCLIYRERAVLFPHRRATGWSGSDFLFLWSNTGSSALFVFSDSLLSGVFVSINSIKSHKAEILWGRRRSSSANTSDVFWSVYCTGLNIWR